MENAGNVEVVCKNANIAKEQEKSRLQIIDKRWWY